MILRVVVVNGVLLLVVMDRVLLLLMIMQIRWLFDLDTICVLTDIRECRASDGTLPFVATV